MCLHFCRLAVASRFVFSYRRCCDGVTIVVSPLIALMKDQVDALRTSGIAATFLNSTLAGSESRERLRGLDRNQFRLLYVAPERLMMEDFLERALNWTLGQIAIDEAHAIREGVD